MSREWLLTRGANYNQVDVEPARPGHWVETMRESKLDIVCNGELAHLTLYLFL